MRPPSVGAAGISIEKSLRLGYRVRVQRGDWVAAVGPNPSTRSFWEIAEWLQYLSSAIHFRLRQNLMKLFRVSSFFALDGMPSCHEA
jgi:hypothetical protein